MSKPIKRARRRHSLAWDLMRAIYSIRTPSPSWKPKKAHRPHQGNAERERRLAKIKAGKIPPEPVPVKDLAKEQERRP